MCLEAHNVSKVYVDLWSVQRDRSSVDLPKIEEAFVEKKTDSASLPHHSSRSPTKCPETADLETVQTETDCLNALLFCILVCSFDFSSLCVSPFMVQQERCLLNRALHEGFVFCKPLKPHLQGR